MPVLHMRLVYGRVGCENAEKAEDKIAEWNSKSY